MVALRISGMPIGTPKYFISFLDTATRYVYVAPITSQAEASAMVYEFMELIPQDLGMAPRWFVTDNAIEYTAEVVYRISADMGTQHIPSISYHSEENGLAEMFNRTIMNAVRAALITSDLSWYY